MAILNQTTYDPVLKQHFSKKRIFPMAALKNPFFGVVEKKTDAGGKYIVQVVDFEDPQGGSSDLSVSLSNTGASKYEDFLIYRKNNYQVAKILNETIEASKSDQNAFIPALKEIDRAFRRCGRRYGIQIYRTGGGYIGRVESGTTLGGTTINLDDHADAFNFQVGMEIGLSANPGTGSLKGSPTYLAITDINREGGTITVESAISGISGAADTDYIFSEGDHGATLQGLADWIPPTAPSATSFNSVDRTTDSDRLGGLRRQTGGEPLLETAIKSTATASKHGADPNLGLLNPETLSDLFLEMEGKVQIERTSIPMKMRNGRKNQEIKTSIGFDAIKVNVGGHDVELMKDVNCPSNRFYILMRETWTFYSAGMAPMFLNRDGLLQRGATTDDYQVRTGGYANLGCSAPGYNIVNVLS